MKTLRHAIFDLREASGSLGDLGTFLPLLVGMTSQNGLDFTPALFFAGFFNVVTGLVFSIPMAVQPMKAIAAVALVQGLTPGQICAAGLMVSLLLLVAASTRGLSVLQDRLPMPVIRGLQMGLGFSLFAKGVELVQRVLAHVEQLTAHPESGSRPQELPRSTRYRQLVEPPCRIFYRFDGERAFVLHIMRSERKLRPSRLRR